MVKNNLHFEPYVQLAELTSTTALIAWGGFYFYRSFFTGRWQLAHDHQLEELGIPRTQTIGASAHPYGKACVTVFDADNKAVASVTTETKNHVHIEGLTPNTEYTYSISVNDRDFTAGPLYDCAFDKSGRHLGIKPGGKRYQLRFRTYPGENVEASLNFAVLGDYGIGVHRFLGGYRQLSVARALELAMEDYDIRMILTTGDNVYKDTLRLLGTGDEDDDWFYAFYQPYRYLLSQVPFYPAIGNHDTGETEQSDDRHQLIDNFYIKHRFNGEHDEIASLDPGLLYRFHYGKSIEFLCVDSSSDEETGGRLTELPEYRDFIARAIESAHTGTKNSQCWRIIFTHHPPYCAGPKYGNDEDLLRSLVPLVEKATREKGSGCIVLSGHEHNFQYSHANDVDYFITGAGGKLRLNPPTSFETANTRAWAAAPHFLMMEISSRHLAATPFGLASGDRLLPLHLRDPSGNAVRAPILISRR